MNSDIEWCRGLLQGAFLFEQLSENLQKAIGQGKMAVRYQDGQKVLSIKCENRREARRLAGGNIYSSLAREVSNPSLLGGVKAIEYRYSEEYGHKSFTMPVLTPMQHTLTAIASTLPMIDDIEILTELKNNWQPQDDGRLILLPSTFVLMDTNKCIYCSDDVETTCGVRKGDLLAIASNAPYFPPGELARYTNAIFEGQGGRVIIEYVAKNIDSDRLLRRKVEVQMFRTTWGRVGRLVKNLYTPVPLD